MVFISSCPITRPPRGVWFTNSRTIFWIFTNSRMREKWQVSRFQEWDFVSSRATINKYAGIHEFMNKFSQIHERKKPIPAFTNIAWGLSNTPYSNIIFRVSQSFSKSENQFLVFNKKVKFWPFLCSKKALRLFSCCPCSSVFPKGLVLLAWNHEPKFQYKWV